jgi:hypothetical protein
LRLVVEPTGLQIADTATVTIVDDGKAATTGG